MITGPTQTVKRARRLRSEMSLPQTVLWRELRKRPGGFKFRREHPAGVYVLDFFVASVRLDIEIDGFAHDSVPATVRDRRRSDFLRSQGVATVRIPAKAVLDDLSAAIARVVQICEERKARLTDSRNNPPPKGEGDHAQHGGGAPSGLRGLETATPAAPLIGTPLASLSLPDLPLHQPAAGPPPRAGED